MKKTLALVLACVMLCCSLVTGVSALKSGDPIGWVLYTNVVAYIDNYPIASYNIDGNTYIVVEDLMNFGFEVTWDGATSRLSVGDKTGAITSTYKPTKNTHNPGDHAFQYLYTNVTTWLKGVQVTGYNIGGYTCVCMDDLATYYAADYEWIGAKSELRLTTGKNYTPAPQPQGNQTYGTSGNISWSFSNGTLTVSGNGAMPDYIDRQEMPWDGVRSKVKALVIENGVTSVSAEAFSMCQAMESVSLPATLESIGDNAFYFCDALTTVTIPSGVSTVGDNVFGRCTSLAEIRVNSANPYFTAVNGVLYNKGQTKLYAYPAGKTATSYEIPSTVPAIGYGAFCYSYKLKTVSLPSKLTTIGAYAFEECEELNSLSVPSTVTFIGDGAFKGCVSMKTITIPTSVTTMGMYVFKNWTASQSVKLARNAAPATWDDSWDTGCKARITWGN